MHIEQFEDAKRYVGFDEACSRALRDFHPIAESRLSPIIDDFYETIDRHPAARAVITGGAPQVVRLKATLLSWLNGSLLGPHDAKYLRARVRIGRTHVRISLPQELMFLAMNRVRQGLCACCSELTPQIRRDDTERAIHQLLDLELAIMLDSYREDWMLRVQATERLATIGKFAASIGHELRNPLGVVESSLFLIGQRLNKLNVSDEVLAKHQNRITEQVKSCGDTISALLELARENPLKRSRHVLQPLVSAAVTGVIVPAGVRVENHVPDALEVFADEPQLRRVFTNLFLNAIHALGDEGSVVIKARHLPAGIEVWVEDDGPGITDGIRDRIFDIWFTTKASGTGIGLALSRKIVEAHGGTLTLERSDHGAAFRMFIPNDT